jgi:hypothetical protein
MAVTLSITPASGSITATVDACKVSVAGASANDATAYDANATPTEPEKRYRIFDVLGGADVAHSHEFNVNGGAHVWDNFVFETAGSHTLELRDLTNSNAVVASLSVTVA